MNEELLLEIFNNKGYNTGGSFDDFKKSMMDSPDLRRAVYDKDFTTGGSYDDFEKAIGVNGGLPPLPANTKGPIGVSRPPVMANPGMDNDKLKDYYQVDRGKLSSIMLTPTGDRPSMRVNEQALAELEKGAKTEREKKAADWLNRPGDVLTKSKEIYSTEFNKKKEKYSKDPQIADAEFSFEALGHYRKNAELVYDRSKERLRLLYSDRYTPEKIDDLIDTHTALLLMGKTEAANKMVAENPDLFSDPNANNIYAAARDLRDASLADSHVIRNNPSWYKRQQKVRERQEEVDIKDMVIDAVSPVSPGAMLTHPNIGNTLKSRVGAWAKNLAVGPGMRDWGRDMMDFNPKSSDYMGHSIETYKNVSLGNKSYDVVYEDDKVAYIRNPKTGHIIQPESDELKAIEKAGESIESSTRFNAKPFVGQTTDVILDMAPIIALTYATGGMGSSLGLSLSASRNIGMVAGSALQTRGDIMDQMLLHPDISPAEAELYTMGIGTGIGLISLINPLERKVLEGSVGAITRKNINRFLNKEITKGQLAWEITKDVAKTTLKEPLEETIQDVFQYKALKFVDDQQEGEGTFTQNKKPDFNSILETSIISAAVGLLGGAGSIRTNRNTYIDDALNTALSKPKVVENYLADMKVGADLIEDPEKRKEALDHVSRLQSRWQNLYNNISGIKGLDKSKRGQLASLIADSNAIEAELEGVTNKVVQSIKQGEITEINKMIKELIEPPAPAAQPAATTTTTTTDVQEDNEDIDRKAADNIALVEDQGAELSVEYFKTGQSVVDDNGPGKVVDVHLNKDGTTHTIDIEYDDTTIPKRNVSVFGKSPQEIGVKVVKGPDSKTEPVKPKPDEPSGDGEKKTDTEASQTKASIPVMITKKMEADLRAKGLSQEKIDKLTPQEANDILNAPPEQKAQVDPALKAEIDKETNRLAQERTIALKDLDDLVSVDPGLDAAPLRQKIEDDYNAGVRDINVTSRKNLINQKRDADIKKAKEVGKRRGVDVEATGTLARIKQSYDDQIAAVEKEFGVADELKKEAAADKKVVTGEIEGQRDEKLFPRKDYESNPAFQTVQKKYQKSKGKVYGKSVSRTLPSGEKVTGKYVLINKNDLAASHLPNSFTKTPGVPVTPSGNTFNDNDYETSKSAQATQIRIAKNFDERAIDDLVFVDSNGIVKSGNGRTISRQMSDAKNSSKYLDALKQRAAEFGFTDKQIKAIGDENVIMAVEIEGDPVYNTKEYSKFNATSEKQKTPLQKAVSIAKSIGEKTIGLIANVFDEADVMSDLSPKDVQRIKEILLKAGIITELDQNQYFDENDKLTASGSEFVENILLSSVFNEDELRILANNPKLRKKLSQNRVRLLKNSQKGRLSIIPKIRQALYLINAARQFEGTFESRLLQQITQGSLFSAAGEYDAETISIALVLNNASMLRKALDQLNASEEAADLFGNTVSSDEIVNHTLETLKADLNEEGKKLIDIAAAIPRTEAKHFTPATDVGISGSNEQTNDQSGDQIDTSPAGEETEGEPDQIEEFNDQDYPLGYVNTIVIDDNLSDEEKVSRITEFVTPYLQKLSQPFQQHLAEIAGNEFFDAENIAEQYAIGEVNYDYENPVHYYVREVIREREFEEHVPDINGNYPNAHGVYDEQFAENLELKSKKKGYEMPDAEIHVLQLANKGWIVSWGYNQGTSGFSMPLSYEKEGMFATREEAINHAAQGLVSNATDQRIKNWAHDIIELIGGQQPEIAAIDQPFFQETNVAKPAKKKAPKKAKSTTTTDQKISDIDKEINDIFDYFKKVSIAVTPEQQAEDMRMGIRLINLYIQKGIYTMKGIIEDMITRMDKPTAERLLPYVKRGYLSSKIDLDKNTRDQMDGEDTVLDITVDDAVQQSNETIEDEIEEPEEEAVSENEPRDTATIIDAAEAALVKAEVAATPEEINQSLNDLEAAISEATSKIGELVKAYSTENIVHETPSVEIAKQAKRDITKHAKEIARLTGWEAKYIYANIPPAGGEVGVTFAIPNTNLSVTTWIKYEPQEVSPYDDYLFKGMMYRVEQVENGRPKSLTTNQLVWNSMSAKEVASTLFKAAKPFMAKELTAPVEIPDGIKPAEPDLGPLFAAKPIEKSPNLAGKSSASGRGKPRNRPNRNTLDPVHQGFQQGLLFGAEPEGDTQPRGEQEGEGISGGIGEDQGDGGLSTGGRGGSSGDVYLPPNVSINPTDSTEDQSAKTVSHNYHFPNDYTGPTTFNQPARFKDNLAALRTLITLLKEKRDALPQEQEILSKYVGWGGLKVILLNEKNEWSKADDAMRPLVKELKDVIAELESLGIKNIMNGIRGSVLNAHYTSIPIIRSIYSILFRMGFNGGKVLEPSAGIGNFLGAMPGLMAANSQLHGVELEQLTGHILKKLYPHAMITIDGYENAKYANNNFDLIISNVPFGNYRVSTDLNAPLILKKAAARIHNYFFVRALDQVKEGGLIAFISTSATLDTADNKFVRDHLNENADFLGAIRLPSTAFQGNAGTQVVTDIIFLRKNTTGPKSNPNFINTKPLTVQHKNNGKDISIQVNEYFVDNPDHVIGEFKAGGLYAEDEMTVIADRSLNVAEAVDAIQSNFPSDVFNPQNASHTQTPASQEEIDMGYNGEASYYIDDNGKPSIKKEGLKSEIPKTHQAKIPTFIKLRETLRKQYELELYSDSEALIEANRKELLKLYNSFVNKNGFLNSNKNRIFITNDEFGFNVLSLENWDKDKQTATKADILSQRSLNRVRKATSANSISDAVAISINETATVDLARIAELMGAEVESVFNDGYGLFFKDTDGRIVERGEYLSGNVKHKLKLAKELAEVDPLFAKNVEELEKVIPEDIPYTEIDINIGARWVPTKYYEEFLSQLLGTSNLSVGYSRAADTYKIEGVKTVDSTSKYGTHRLNAYELMEMAMHGKTPVVRDLVDPGPPKKYEVNEAETQAANDKFEAIVSAFEDWILADYERAKHLESIYNDLYNTSVKRTFDGSYLEIDGLTGITLRSHQKDAVSMLVLNNGGIVDHIVGAGKTYTMISAAIKMKQTGIANKPTIIALPSTIPQIVADAKKAYPSARILAPTKNDFKKHNRKALLARIQNNDWDLVIISHDQFKFIPQDPEFESQLIIEEIEALQAEVEAIIAESGKENKRLRTALENKIKSLEEKLEKVQNRIKKDTELLNFKEIGIDHLFVDESQQYKNLTYTTRLTNIAGLGDPEGSDRAFNLLSAIRTLQALHNGDKGTTFLSGTPISNSLVEMYLLLKYLRPNKLKEIGYDTFDSWAKNAARQSSEMEFTVTGTVSTKNRFREFINIPEVALLYTEIADVRNELNLQLPRPTVRGGKPTLITVKQSEAQKALTERLIKFARQKHGKRNGALIGIPDMSEGQQKSAMLLVTGIGAKMAIDMRLFNPRAAHNPDGKLSAVAKTVFQEYQDSHDIKGTQLIFSDLGTPKSGNIKVDLRNYLQDEMGIIEDDLVMIFGDADKPKSQTLDKIKESLAEVLEFTPQQIEDAVTAAQSYSPFNAYDGLKELLMQKGIPENEIAFIHHYDSDAKKEKLYEDVNAGKVRIVIGSTGKLGTGVNVQKRIVALHHVDASWKPADMIQRNGRGIRQGNMNSEVAIYNYATEGTLDAYKYQLIAAKQKFIDQVKTGATGKRREKEGEGEDMTAQEWIARISGDETLLDKAKIDAVVAKLKRTRRAHESEQYQIKKKISEAKEGVTSLTAAIANREADLKTVKANSKVVTEQVKEMVDSLEYNDFDHLKADPRISDIEVKMMNRPGSKEQAPFLVYNKSRMEPDVVIRGKVPKDSEERNKWIEAITTDLKKKYGQTVGGQEVIGQAGGLDIIGKVVLKDRALYVNYVLSGNFEYPTSPTTFSPAVNKIEPDIEKAKVALQERKDSLAKLNDLDGKPWTKEEEYEEALKRQKELELKMKANEAAEAAKAADADKPLSEEEGEVSEAEEMDDDIQFSIQQEAKADAQEAVDNGNTNPNAPIIIRLVDENASPEARLQQYASVWLDSIQKVHPEFYKKGIDLIQGTPYDAMRSGGTRSTARDHHMALADAIADKAVKTPKNSALISWVKQFWKRVGKMLRLNISPEQLQEMTIADYLTVAAAQLRYGADIYADLVAEGANVPDVLTQPQAAKPTPQETQKAVEAEFEAQAEEYTAQPVRPAAKPVNEPPISVEKEFEFDSRDLNATGTVFSNPRSPEAERLLRDYTGAKKRLIETIFLLFPTLKNAGIKLYVHEDPDSYYNAMVSHGGTRSQAIRSGGFYKGKEIHINLAKPDLKDNTALHEAFHPIIRDLLLNDKPTFRRFVSDILNDPDLKKKYHDEFAQRYANLPPDSIAEEILVEATADTVLKRILSSMEAEKLSDSLFDRILSYIKKALGDTYGQLVQFINTKNSFAEFAHSMADAISKGMAVPVNASIEDSVRTIVNDSIQLSEDSTVSLLPNVFSKSGQVNHEKVKRIAKQVIDGSAVIRRLNPTEERGRILGGNRNVEVSILLGAGESTSGDAQSRSPNKEAEINRQIRLIEDYAKGQGILFPLSRIQEEFEFLDDGAEADVYVDDIADYVLKTVKITPFGNTTPLNFIDERISLHNYLFPDAKYELVGFAKDETGALHYMLRQPFIQADGRVNNSQLESHMDRYFKMSQNMNTGSPETSYINSNYLVEDLHNKNVLRSKTGMLHFIDTFAKLNTPEDGYGGNRSYAPFDVVQNQPISFDAQFSMQDDDRKEQIKANLKHRLQTNPEVNFEPIAENLIKKGILTKMEADDILTTWRQSRIRKLNHDDTLAALADMAALQHLHKMDHDDNTKVNQESLKNFIADWDNKVETLLERYPPSFIKSLVEEVAASGDSHPLTVIEEMEALNNRKSASGAPSPAAAGPRTLIASAVAQSELKKAKKFYGEIYERTGSQEAFIQMKHIDDAMSRLVRATFANRSISGSSLGIGSKLLQLAGLTYESELAHLEAINKSESGKNIEIAQEDKEQLARLIKEHNILQEAFDKLVANATPKKTKADAAKKEFIRKTNSSLESKPTRSKEEVLEHLRKMRAVRASLSLSLSLDDPEFTYFDDINELAKIAHVEGAKGFKEVVAKIREYDPSIKEDDIYNAILSTTPLAKQKALSEYAKRQALTRKHVKDINNVESMLTKHVVDLLRKQKQPNELAMAEFGELINDIEKNIYQLDAKNELVTRWINALDTIKTNYGLAFLNPEPSESSELMISKILNAVRVLHDQKFHDWLKNKNDEINKEIDRINSGQIAQLVHEEDESQESLPDEMVVLKKNANGEIIGTEIVKKPLYDEKTDKYYSLGGMDRLIKDKIAETDKLKAKYRKQNPYFLFYKRLRGTLGSSVAMADLSYLWIQGQHLATTAIRNPRQLKQFFQDFGKSLRAMRDEFRKNPGLANEYHLKLTEEQYYDISQASGLTLIAPDAHIFVNEMLSEEDWFDIWNEKLKGKKGLAAKVFKPVLAGRKRIKVASNAAFATHLNQQSYHRFAAYIDKVKSATGQMPTPRELKVLANEINRAAGRTTRISKVTQGASWLFWAPKLYLSQVLNIANIIGDPVNFAANLIAGNKDLTRVYGHRMINSMIFAATTAAIYYARVLFAKMQCGELAEVNMDASKPSFLKIKCGELSLDPSGNHRQYIALGARLLSAAKGDPYTDFTGQPIPAKEQVVNMFSYKLNPILSTGFELWGGTDFLGRAIIPGDESTLMWKSRGRVLLNHLYPISGGNILDVAQAKGVSTATKPVTMAEALIGSGVQRTDMEKEAARKEAEKAVKAKKKEQTNNKAIDVLEKKYGALKELQGQFESNLPVGAIELTGEKHSDRNGTYRVFKRTDDPDGDGPDDDFYVIKTRKTGKNKGKKYLDKIK